MKNELKKVTEEWMQLERMTSGTTKKCGSIL